MIRAIRPSAMAQDDASVIGGWNVAPNVGYTLVLTPGATACGVLLFDASMSVLVASGAGLVGVDQPVILLPYAGQAIGMVDADLGWHMLVTTDGTEAQQTIRIGPAVDLPGEIHPIYTDDNMALARATAAIDAAAHYIDDVTVTCPLGIGAVLEDVVSVPVDGATVVGQVESITWAATPDGTNEQAVIRRHVAIAPEAYVEPVPITPPVVADDTGATGAATATSGNVLTNDDAGLTVVAVNGLSSLVGVAVAGNNGGTFTIASDGAWTFDPAGGFAALEGSETANTSVTYHASDGVSEAVATLTVTVSAGDTEPELWTAAEIATSLWLKESGAVSSWTDHSGGDRHATQSTPPAQPQITSLNGLQVFNFDNGDYMLTPGIFTSPSDVSIFIVKKATNTNSTGRAAFSLGGGLNSQNGFFHALCRTDITNGFRSVFTTNGSTSNMVIMYPPSAFATGSWVISGHGRSSTSQFLSWNGMHSEVAVSGQCNFANVKGFVGGYYNTNFLWSGQIAEIIVCPSYVDATTRQKIEGYLAHKWGLSAKLPSGHPYKSAPPYVE